IRAHAELLERHGPDSDSRREAHRVRAGRHGRTTDAASAGYLILDPSSIRFYRDPITLADLQHFWPDELGHVTRLSNVRRRLGAGPRRAYEAFAVSRCSW